MIDTILADVFWFEGDILGKEIWRIALCNKIDCSDHGSFYILIPATLKPAGYGRIGNLPTHIGNARLAGNKHLLIGDPQPIHSERLVESHQIALNIQFDEIISSGYDHPIRHHEILDVEKFVWVFFCFVYCEGNLVDLWASHVHRFVVDYQVLAVRFVEGGCWDYGVAEVVAVQAQLVDPVESA